MVFSSGTPVRRAQDCPSGEPWDEARVIVERLLDAGYEAWFVGGCIRDLMLGEAVHDVDVTTNARPEQVETLFPKTVAVGKAFGVILVITPSGKHVEVATYRHDGAYIDGRRPESIRFGTIDDDVKRRDFTINALLLSPSQHLVVDYVGGLSDLERRCLRAVGDPARRFAEDRLRILRALRFAARLQLTIDQATWQALCKGSLCGLSAERIVQEWEKALSGSHRAAWFDLLVSSGHLTALFPPDATPNAAEHPALRRNLEKISGTESLAVKQAIWLRSCSPDRVAAWLKQLPGPRQRWERIRWLLDHDHPNQIGSWPLHRRRRLLQDTSASDLIAFWRCCHGECTSLPGLISLYDTEQKAGPWEPLVTARDLLAIGYQPGKALGKALKTLEEEQLEEKITSKTQALEQARQRQEAFERDS